jgi:hypothetical protein
MLVGPLIGWLAWRSDARGARRSVGACACMRRQRAARAQARACAAALSPFLARCAGGRAPRVAMGDRECRWRRQRRVRFACRRQATLGSPSFPRAIERLRSSLWRQESPSRTLRTGLRRSTRAVRAPRVAMGGRVCRWRRQRRVRCACLQQATLGPLHFSRANERLWSRQWRRGSPPRTLRTRLRRSSRAIPALSSGRCAC